MGADYYHEEVTNGAYYSGLQGSNYWTPRHLQSKESGRHLSQEQVKLIHVFWRLGTGLSHTAYSSLPKYSAVFTVINRRTHLFSGDFCPNLTNSSSQQLQAFCEDKIQSAWWIFFIIKRKGNLRPSGLRPREVHEVWEERLLLLVPFLERGKTIIFFFEELLCVIECSQGIRNMNSQYSQ